MSGEAQPVPRGHAAPSRATIRGGESALLLAVAVVVAWFDVWTVRSNGDAWKFGQEQRDYYNLLIDGWLEGHLHLKVEVPDALLKLPNPYDHRARPAGLGLHDASFYQGKYYLYFGGGPIVVLMLPFRILTGIDLPLAVATLIFSYGAFVAAAATWLVIRRRYFPEAGPVVAALGVLALGFVGLGPVLLRRPQIWELPIAAGSFFALLTLLCVFRCLHESRRAGWLMGASVCLGLAIASRPTYLVATPLLALPLFVWWREARRVPWRPAVAAVAPLAVIGALLASHNWLRFGNPFESGQAYQFNFDYESRFDFFSVRYLPFNAWRYFFAPAQWLHYFPFIAPAALPPDAQTFGGHEDLYGVLVNLPLGWAALLSPLALWRRDAGERRRLGAWLAAATFLFVALVALLLCFFGATVRYLLDFTPALVLLACVGILALERWARLALPSALRTLSRLVWGGALLFSVLFAVVFSIQVNGLFRERNPARYREIARLLNHLPAWVERVIGVRLGALEFDLQFPSGRAGQTQTILTVSEPPRVDRVVVRYLDDTHVQLGFQRPAAPEVTSRPLAVDFKRTHRLRLALGALLPPDTHPVFADATAEQAARAARCLRIELDGETVIEELRRFERVSAASVRVAGNALPDAAAPSFTGDVRSSRTARMTADELAPKAAEFFRLRLAFPTDVAGRREPLVSLGGAKIGMLVFAEFLTGNRVRFGCWSAGRDSGVGEPVGVAPGRIGELVVRVRPHREDERTLVQVRLDDALVWSSGNVPRHPQPGSRELGQNLAGDAHSVPTLTARVYSSEIGAAGEDPLFGPGDGIHLSVLFPRNRAGTREPLVVTGRTGEGDLVGVEYIDENYLRFIFDHWGSPLLKSDPVRMDLATVHELEVRMESLSVAKAGREATPERVGGLRVKLDGRIVWELDATFHRAEAEEISIGRNPIGGSHAGPRFTGEVLLATRGSQ